jgi:molybdopterin converting factor small subunit
MAKVTIQYWAAAREAAGVQLESVEARTLAEALDVIVARRGDDGRLRSVLAAASFLVDGTAASRGAAPDVVLPDAAVIEVLPQFAGGLGLARMGGYAGNHPPAGGDSGGIAADWVDNALQYPYQHVPKSHSGAP